MLNIALVKQLAARAAEAASAVSCAMSIAIVDGGANLVYVERMDEAMIGSVATACRKARSAVLFKRPTKVFEEMLAGGRMAILTLPDVIPIEGGVPLTVEGRIEGAIGISGGTAEQDGSVANTAADSLAGLVAGNIL
jgi:glc operon protein GlcG